MPGPSTVRHGGNTPCLELRDGPRRLLLDAGTGVAAWGRAAPGPDTIDLLLSHTHWDHIQGLPFLPQLHRQGARVRVLGPAPAGVPLRQALEHLLAPAHFPVGTTALRGILEVTEIEPLSSFEVGGLHVDAHPVRHPVETLGYRVWDSTRSLSLTYMTDNELDGNHPVPHELVRFVRGSQVLVHDAMNGEGQQAARRGWGHSTPSAAIRLAAAAGVGELLLFHHDPSADDERLDAMTDRARALAAIEAPGLRVSAAAEGRAILLD